MSARLTDQAIAHRDLARRARRLADTQIAPDVVGELLRYADSSRLTRSI